MSAHVCNICKRGDMCSSNIGLHTYVSTCMYAYAYVYTYVCIYICVWKFMNACMYACANTNTYFIYTYIHAHGCMKTLCFKRRPEAARNVARPCGRNP